MLSQRVSLGLAPEITIWLVDRRVLFTSDSQILQSSTPLAAGLHSQLLPEAWVAHFFAELREVVGMWLNVIAFNQSH